MIQFPLTSTETALGFLIVCGGSFVQGNVGFGMGLMCAPLLALVHSHFVPLPLLLGGMMMTSTLSIRERRGVNKQFVLWAVLGHIPCAILGALTLSLLRQNTSCLGLALGILILVAVGMTASGLHPPVSRRNLWLAGGIAGFMGTATSVGGPPMAIILQRQQATEIRGTLSAFYLIGAVISVSSLACTGQFHLNDLLTAIPLGCGALTGVYLSNHSHKHLPQKIMRPLILTLATISAVILIVKSTR